MPNIGVGTTISDARFNIDSRIIIVSLKVASIILEGKWFLYRGYSLPLKKTNNQYAIFRIQQLSILLIHTISFTSRSSQVTNPTRLQLPTLSPGSRGALSIPLIAGLKLSPRIFSEGQVMVHTKSCQHPRNRVERVGILQLGSSRRYQGFSTCIR
jgi:hypothetical protein